MALSKIVPSTLRLSTSLMSQTSQLTFKILHLPPPLSFSPPPPLGRELQDWVSVITKQMTEMFQSFDAKMQNRFDQVMQQQQDLLLKYEDSCLNVAIVSQSLAEQVDAVAVDESYLHPDYDLISEKVLETTEDFKAYWKPWRKFKEAILEPYIDSSKMNQVVEQGIIKEELSNPEQAFIQLKETEILCLQPNCELILGENVETIKPTNFIQSYLHLSDNLDDQQLIVIDSLQLLKTTKIDTQILVEREENFVQFELIRKLCNQILRFDNRKVLIWELTWHRKKARVRYKRDIKCYLMG